jgi:hypothetical protein
VTDPFTNRLFEALRQRKAAGTWIPPQSPIPLDLPADVSEQDIRTARESGFLPRLVLPDHSSFGGNI